MVRATVGARQQRIQPRRRLFLHTREYVRIGVHRQRDRCVPEHLLDDLRMLAVDETERRRCVTKIVEPYCREASGLEERFEALLGDVRSIQGQARVR